MVQGQNARQCHEGWQQAYGQEALSFKVGKKATQGTH
jgi:hypothetical protein